jgi:hypothetical protein
MMLDTHRSKRNEHAQSTRRANHPRVGTGVLRSKVEGSSKIFLLLLARVLLQGVGQGPQRLAVELFPPNRGLGQSPNFIGAVRRTFKLLRRRSSPG